MSQETILYNGPTTNSGAVGKLPKGTVLIFLGEKEAGFVFVRVELVDGEAQGWVRGKTIQSASAEETKKLEKGSQSPLLKKGPLRRGAVPPDEALLLRRVPTFLYGLYLGGSLNIINTEFTEDLFNGVGFSGGGHLGFFLSKDLILGGDIGYTLTNGSNADGNVSFGLFDVGMHLDYSIDRFVITGGLLYSFGIGIGNIPRKITIGSASDVSGLWGTVGAGVRFPVTEVVSFVLKGRYGVSFTRAPIGFQTLGAFGCLEVKG